MIERKGEVNCCQHLSEMRRERNIMKTCKGLSEYPFLNLEAAHTHPHSFSVLIVVRPSRCSIFGEGGAGENGKRLSQLVLDKKWS